MMKSIRTLVRQDREKYVIPRRVQDVIPIQKIWEDGIFLTGGRYAKTFRFTDINYQVASEPDKEKMFRGYSALINSLDCGATTKITIFNHKMSQINFEKSILMPMQWDGLDDYREEYNQMLLDKATNGNGIVQEKFLTVSVRKKDVDAARSFFARVEADLSAHFAALGSTCTVSTAGEKKMSSVSLSVTPPGRVTASGTTSARIPWNGTATISRSGNGTPGYCTSRTTPATFRMISYPS